jgi:hypothetical protein
VALGEGGSAVLYVDAARYCAAECQLRVPSLLLQQLPEDWDEQSGLGTGPLRASAVSPAPSGDHRQHHRGSDRLVVGMLDQFTLITGLQELGSRGRPSCFFIAALELVLITQVNFALRGVWPALVRAGSEKVHGGPMVGWTAKRVQRLVLLHKEGFSATVIAKKLGPAFTKGMVAGKLRRLSIDAPKRTAANQKPFVARQAAPAQSPIILTKPPSSQPCEPQGIRIFELRERHCRWPLGDDRPAKFFCGAPAVPSKSWCEHHYALAYGHRPAHQNREAGESAAEMLLRALQTRSKSRQTTVGTGGSAVRGKRSALEGRLSDGAGRAPLVLSEARQP